MRIAVREIELLRRKCMTRTPFRFGITTMHEAPLVLARVLVEQEDGRTMNGFSSDLLVPKWFEKDPEKSADEDIRNLIESAVSAGSFAREIDRFASVFDLWWALHRHRVASQPIDAPDLLVRGFGVALIERAVMDAACRLADMSFFEALKRDLFAFNPGGAIAKLRGWRLGKDLPSRPRQRIMLRHTVGLLDPLDASDLSDENRIGDGLPETLEENIRRYGLTHFKIKVQGRIESDLERLMRITKILQASVKGPPHITLDGNEQFESIEQLFEFMRLIRNEEDGRYFINHLVQIEQPLSRTHTFEKDRNAWMDQVSDLAPVIIDEADSHIEAFERAAELGYWGVSVKNCKGVFRSLLNRGLCARSTLRLFQSAEDLTNLPIVALQQDLATIAAMGLRHAERNGHHYFHGLDHLPGPEAAEAAAKHPGLYEIRGDHVYLTIANGQLDLGSLQCPGYGYDVSLRPELWESIERV